MKDPVCKMEVKEDSKFKGSYKGMMYYFCSAACKHSFDKDPGKYAKA